MVNNSDKQKEHFPHHEMRLHLAAYRPCLSRKPWRICLKSGQYCRDFARYSTGPLISPQPGEVNVHVKVGSSGHISLEIYHPPRPPFLQCPIILYLPRCGAQGHAEIARLSALASSSNSIVVCLNYRLSTQHQFPVPIHDVLAGYDWIRKHLVSGGPENWPRKAKLGVCGEFLGGSLASMLALTECHKQRQGIAAAGIGNPVANWTSLGFGSEATEDISSKSTLCAKPAKKKLPSSGTIPWTGKLLRTESLLSLRDDLFPKEDRFFDPFASPLLFFREPVFDLEGLQLAESAVASATADPTAGQASGGDSASVLRNRLAHRKYPPRNSGLRLPQMRVELGEQNVLKEQGLEFVKLMRRSVRLWEYQEKDDLHNDGSDRIELLERTDFGWWGDEEIYDLGTWFARRFADSTENSVG